MLAIFSPAGSNKKNVKNKLKFIGGAVVGTALGIAAGLFLSSKKGKEMTSKAKEKLSDFYVYISPELKKIKEMGEREYNEFIEKAGEKYSKAKKLTEKEAKELIKEAKSAWKQIIKNAKEEKGEK